MGINFNRMPQDPELSPYDILKQRLSLIKEEFSNHSDFLQQQLGPTPVLNPFEIFSNLNKKP